MSNFGFIRDDWPGIFDACTRAEANLARDPRAACFYARRAGELVAEEIHTIEDLPRVRDKNFLNLLRPRPFRDVVDQPILDKFHVLRKVGNTAVHASGDVKKATARLLLNELFHVVVWAAQRYTVHPDDVPVHAQFSPSRISSDRTGATGSADHTVLRRTAERQQAEITELRAAIADARARRTGSDTHDYYEAATRRVLVDELLHEAGWDPDPADADHELTGSGGDVLAVVGTGEVVGEVRRRMRLTADRLAEESGVRPVIFYSNGVDTYLWDDTEGYPPRRTQGFYTRAELENLVARRGGRPLAEVLSDAPDGTDGTDGTDAQRPAVQDLAAHQRQAVRATVTAFDHRQRGALLVMAPGTGRVATTAAIVDVLAEAGWADRVAYLADDARRLERARTALAELDRPGIYTMTYSQLMDRVERLEFGPGFFDLVVVDETAPSVRGAHDVLFEYFDALLLGFTCNPPDPIDQGTFALFGQPEGQPTFQFTAGDAVEAGVLVPARTVSVSGVDGSDAAAKSAALTYLEEHGHRIDGELARTVVIDPAEHTDALPAADPEITHIVLLDDIGSPTRLRELIGRAMLPHPGKTEALVIDTAGNLAYLDQELPDADPGRVRRAVDRQVRLLEHLDSGRPDGTTRTRNCGDAGDTGDTGDTKEREATAGDLASYFRGLDTDSVVLRPFRRTVEWLGSAGTWSSPLDPQVAVSASEVAGLPGMEEPEFSGETGHDSGVDN